MPKLIDYVISKRIRIGYIGFAVGLIGLLLAIFYRPFVYKNNIADFHFADTLGSLFCVPASVLFYYGFKKKSRFLKTFFSSVITFTLYEVPSSIKSGIDFYDYFAIIIGALFTYIAYFFLKKYKLRN